MSRVVNLGRVTGAAVLFLTLPGVARAQQFEPAPRVLYEAVFTADDLPPGLNILNGNVTPGLEAGKPVLLVMKTAMLEIALPETLPDRFTIEVDGLIKWGWGHHVGIRVPLPEDATHALRVPGLIQKRGVIRCSGRGSGALGKGFDRVEHQDWDATEGETPCHVMVDGDRTQVFFGDSLISDRQPIDLGRGNRLHIYIPANPTGERDAIIRRIRVAAYPPDLYGEIEKSGRVTAEGIYFDTGSDVLRDESRPVLEQIAQMLTEHPELSLAIEGHTDNVGDAAANQTLSEQRAAAVRTYLVEQLGIDAARLTTAGFGASRPVAPNDTPEGRQQNRRVELVRK